MKAKSRTCIALCKTKAGELIMAGDRKVSSDWSFSYKCPNPKIRKTWNGILIGASGDSALCKTLIDIFEPPKIETEDLDLYMSYNFIPAIYKHIKCLPGYVDEHKLLRLALGEGCTLLLGFQNKGYIIEIENPEETIKEYPISRVIFDDIPIPFVIGCGAPTAFPILQEEYNKKGYNTKQTLGRAMSVAAEISPGADNNIDYISSFEE